jgi:16S rRNA (guanine527-N7)-methyltransferase
MLSEYRARLTGGLRQTLERAAKLGMLGNSAEIDVQIDHALGFVQTFESSLGRPPRSVLDLGSGGGLPGLVLHQVWPETEVVLLEASERRAEFLKSELARSEAEGPCSPGPVEVLRGRAETVAHEPRYRERFEGVSSRSFGPPAVVAECGAPFLTTRGVLVVSEPPEGEGSSRWPEAGLAEVGLGSGEATRIEDRFNYRVLPKHGTTPDRFPRRDGVPSKRPLF